MRSRAWALLRVGFGLAGLTFLGIVLARTVRTLGAEAIPPWSSFVVSGALAVGSLLIASRAWACLFDDASIDLRRSFYSSQLGKYIPGGIWQMVALVESGARSGAGVVRSSIRLPVYVLTTIAAGGTIGAAFAAAGTHASTLIRLSAVAGLLATALLDRRLIALVVRIVRRLTRREFAGDPVPSQRAIATSYAYGLATMLASSGAYAVLLAPLPSRVSSLEAITAFALAWTVGFVAIPFPSGLGIREAVLIGVTASAIGGPVAAAAVFQRIVVMVAEVVVVLTVAARKRARVP